MDIPTKVYVTCPLSDLKQAPGNLIAISPLGYYELHVTFGSNTHALMVPISGTTLTAVEPLLTPPAGFEVER